MVFGAIAVNSNPRSEANAAVAVTLHGSLRDLTRLRSSPEKQNREHRVYILSFFDRTVGGYAPRIQVLRSWDPILSVCSSMSLCGDVLVVADSRDRAVAVNVNSPETRAVVLESTTVSGRPHKVRKPR